MSIILDGTSGITLPGTDTGPLLGSLTQATSKTATSTSVEFPNIPSWVKRITVMFQGVSTNGSSQVIVQVGAGSYTTSGYNSAGFGVASSPSYVVTTATNGFVFQDGMAAFVVINGSMVITSLGGNVWTYTAIVNRGPNAGTSYGGFGAGAVTLSGTLDRLRLTTTNGTDAFDSGSINILYE